MRLESGPASGDRNYYLLVTLFCTGMFAYFMYDWQIGYPNSNRKEAIQQLQGRLEKSEEEIKALPQLNSDAPHKELFEQMQASAETDLDVYIAAFGEPVRSVRENERQLKDFVSRYGMATLEVQGGAVTPSGGKYITWKHDKGKVEGQLYWGMIPLVLALFFMMKLIKAMTLKASIDDQGLIYAGKRIPFNAMTDLRDFSPKGWIDLYYDEGDESKRLRLDNQKIGRYDELVAEICREKGFDDPVAEHRARKEAEERGEAPPAETPES